MTNKEIVIRYMKARKEGNREEIENLAVENFELVCKLIELEEVLKIDTYNCGTYYKPIALTVLTVEKEGKNLDKRNGMVKGLEEFLNSWNTNYKHFVLKEIPRRR